MTGLIQCIYSSAATPEFKEYEITPFLEKIRTANAKCGVTGMLLYIEGSFFQILEGPQDIVETLVQKIESDPQHKRVTIIVKEAVAARSFGSGPWDTSRSGLRTLARSSVKMTSSTPLHASQRCRPVVPRNFCWPFVRASGTTRPAYIEPQIPELERPVLQYCVVIVVS